MKAKELIAALVAVVDDDGDLEVWVGCDIPYRVQSVEVLHQPDFNGPAIMLHVDNTD